MKKNIHNKHILFILIGGLLFSIINVGATSTLLNSKSVAYDSTISGSSASSVSDALDELYKLTESTPTTVNGVSIIPLGTGTTYNIKDLYPSIDYKTLTDENFIVGTQGSDYSHSTTGSTGLRCYSSSGGYDTSVTIKYNCSKSMSVTKKYDATTGVLTITASNCTPQSYLVLNPSSTVAFLGNGTTYNIKELYPNIDYTSLNENNFVTNFSSGSHSYTPSGTVGHRCAQSSGGYDATAVGSTTCSGSIKVLKSYDATTGILTITSTNATPNVYFLLGTIR